MIINRNMVLGLIVLMSFLGLIFSQEAFGFMNEPTGYRDNKWGTPIDQISYDMKELVSIEKIKFKAFTPDIELKTMDILFLFLDDKFVAYSVRIKDPDNIATFAMICRKIHGPPTKTLGRLVMWESKAAIVELDVARGLLVAGSAVGTRSLEALFEWYKSQGEKIGGSGADESRTGV